MPELQNFLKNLARYGKTKNIPNISEQTGEILQFLIHISRAKKILEIGCANGFSTIFLADAARKNNGSVLTCDVSAPSFAAAQKNITAAGLSAFVEFRCGDGMKIVRSPEKFDCIFIDAEKKRTHEFFTLAQRHLTKNGLIIIDDTKKFAEKMRAFKSLR